MPHRAINSISVEMTPFYHNRRTRLARPLRGFTLRGGFTLIEAAIVTAIVGIGIVGVLELLCAGSMANMLTGSASPRRTMSF